MNRFLSGKIKVANILVVVELVIILSMATFIFLVASRKGATLILKKDNQTIVTRTEVCNSDIINSFNNASKNVTSNSAYVGNVETLANKVKALSNYQEDPNCIYILYNYSYLKGNASDATQYSNQLESFNNSGLYVSGTFNQISGVSVIKRNAKALSNSVNSSSSSSTSGASSTTNNSTQTVKSSGGKG